MTLFIVQTSVVLSYVGDVTQIVTVKYLDLKKFALNRGTLRIALRKSDVLTST